VEKQPTLKDLLTLGEARLRTSSPSPKLDAEILLAFSCNIPKYKLVTERNSTVSSQEHAHYLTLLSRREHREPVAYLTGMKEFYGKEFTVTPAVLIPRPESELLVDRALEIVRSRAPERQGREVTILDLGTGSGCLILSVVSELRATGMNVRGIAIDLSMEALAIAKRNAHALNCLDLISFLQGDWFSPHHETEFQKAAPFDLILANPPYVAVDEEVSPETTFEPQTALFSGEVGLHDTRIILRNAASYLKDSGTLLIEVGAGKRAALNPFFERHGGLFAEWKSPTLLGDDSPADRFTVLEFQKR
jgi:release factor glutamine methyltransferase